MKLLEQRLSRTKEIIKITEENMNKETSSEEVMTNIF